MDHSHASGRTVGLVFFFFFFLSPLLLRSLVLRAVRRLHDDVGVVIVLHKYNIPECGKDSEREKENKKPARGLGKVLRMYHDEF